ncbi:MAG TPA: hypothetical protein PKN75_07595 [Bacteroidia bacterium]|nr:hypothetical protein [Bacteroidia bacterium]HNU33442.1 hypothetical protein [Bacteroidia bacterium]
MIDKKRNLRAVAISMLVICLSFWNYNNLSGKENIRLIHEVSLLVLGFAGGVFFVNLISLFRKNKDTNAAKP